MNVFLFLFIEASIYYDYVTAYGFLSNGLNGFLVDRESKINLSSITLNYSKYNIKKENETPKFYFDFQWFILKKIGIMILLRTIDIKIYPGKLDQIGAQQTYQAFQITCRFHRVFFSSWLVSWVLLHVTL